MSDDTSAGGAAEFEEHRDRVRRTMPPALYLPVSSAEGGEFHEVELRAMNDGRLALLAYTALDRLADAQGPHQPWMLYPTDRLEDLEQSQPYDVILLDLEIPEALWRRADGTQPQPDPESAS